MLLFNDFIVINVCFSLLLYYLCCFFLVFLLVFLCNISVFCVWCSFLLLSNYIAVILVCLFVCLFVCLIDLCFVVDTCCCYCLFVCLFVWCFFSCLFLWYFFGCVWIWVSLVFSLLAVYTYIFLNISRWNLVDLHLYPQQPYCVFIHFLHTLKWVHRHFSFCYCDKCVDIICKKWSNNKEIY